MLNCLYQGKRINAINIMEESSYDHRKLIKKAGCRKELICEDCGHPVILKAGEIKQAHFAHWKGFYERCPYQEYTSKETEAHKKCKRLVYLMLRQEYPEEVVNMEYNAIPTRRSDLFMEFQTGEKLAIDIHSGSISTAKWDNKHNDYRNQGITDLWFVMGKPYDRKERNMPFFHQIMLNENLNNTAVFILPDSEQVVLIKNMVYKDKWEGKEYNSIFKKEYAIDDIRILPNGKIECDFDQRYNEAVGSFMARFRGQASGNQQTAAITTNKENAKQAWNQISFIPELDDSKESKSSDDKDSTIGKLSEVDRLKFEKYVGLHLDLIISGDDESKKFHIDKLANKILAVEYEYLFVQIRNTMKAQNNQQGYTACVTVINRAKRIKKKQTPLT